MKEISVKGVPFYQFSNIKSQNWITQKPFDMHKERGLVNRRKLVDILELDNEVIFPDQKHTDNIQVVTELNPSYSLSECDALITANKNTQIGVVTADCVPILLEDRMQSVIAAVHAGWRGTVQKILGNTIEKMKTDFNCNPENIFVGIGPSISPSVYEVGEDVYNAYFDKGFDNDLIFKRSDKKGKYYLDLWKANLLQVLEKGVPESNVEIAKMCTFTQNENLYSARRDTINTGRLAAIIKM